MINTKQILALLILTGCAKTQQIQDWTYISFQDKIGFLQNCNGKTITETVTLTTNSKAPVQVFAIVGSPKHVKITYNNKTLTPLDTLTFQDNEPIELAVTITAGTDAKYYHHMFSFRTSHPKYKREVIQFIPNTLSITAQQVQNGGEIIIDKTENCLDSLSIAFPYGGTITTVNLYKTEDDTLNKAKPDKTISYMMYENNKIDFGPNESGEYLVDYSSCHWGNDLIIKIQ